MDSKDVLRGLSLFAGLSEQTLELLASIAERKTFAAGAPVYSEGERDASIFVLMSGSVQIDKLVNFDQQQTLERLRAGDFFGEISFILGSEHCASAHAAQETTVLQIRRTEFDKLATRRPGAAYQIMLRLATQLASLLRNMDEKFVELVGYIYGREKK